MTATVTERLQPLFDQLPDAQRRQREALWQQLLSEGFPTPRHERWKYTDVAAALPEALQPAPPAQLALPAIDGLRRVAFVNGRSHGLHDDEQHAPGDAQVQDTSDLVNASLATGGLLLQPAQTDEPTQLHLCTRATAGSVHLRHRIMLPAGARALLYWDDAVDDDAAFVTQTMEIVLGQDARLDLARRHRNQAAGPTLLRTQARLAQGSRLQLTSLDAGSGLSRHDLHVRLDGVGAQAHLDGLYAPWAQGHVDTFATVEHAAPESVSRMRFRGLGIDRGVGVLVGRVHVHPGAQQIDSDQQLKSLLLSPRAQINAKPELEIYADDVTCAHGNAIGQIDLDALHYLQTRGISRTQARALLIGGFAAEVLQSVDHDGVEAALLGALDEVLAHADWSAT